MNKDKVLLTEEEIKPIFLSYYTLKYGDEAAKELLDQLPDFNYGKSVAQAQVKKLVELFMRYKDIDLEDIIPDDKNTVFFIPNEDLKVIKEIAGVK